MVGGIGFEILKKRIFNDMQGSGWHRKPRKTTLKKPTEPIIWSDCDHSYKSTYWYQTQIANSLVLTSALPHRGGLRGVTSSRLNIILGEHLSGALIQLLRATYFFKARQQIVRP